MYPLDRLNTPPSDEDQLQTETLGIGRRRDSQLDDLPLTPRSGMEEDEEDEAEGANTWSMNDDKELLMHVLSLPLKHIKWKELENQFQDRHLAKMCADRWDYIKKQLLKDIDLTTKEYNANKKSDFVS